uniref:AB hydrolase-1 domain-containing protein n=1 Tax=Steinernema glaseri TaxID=37863 RepID=A0A1I7YQA7_9BILA
MNTCVLSALQKRHKKEEKDLSSTPSDMLAGFFPLVFVALASAAIKDPDMDWETMNEMIHRGYPIEDFPTSISEFKDLSSKFLRHLSISDIKEWFLEQVSVIENKIAPVKDSEQNMSTTEIIRHWGYPVERVDVTTEDGYIIELHHILYGKKSGPRETFRPKKASPICTKTDAMEYHGLDCTSSNWITNLPNQSAGYLFADAGFDVWLGNVRGNTYGKKHQTLSIDDKQFWDYSIDEHVKYDLPAMINTVLNRTGQKDLYYVGHSQGTLTMFSKLASDPAFGQKVVLQRIFPI